MSVAYKAVGWNAFKKKFDRILAGVVLAFLVVFFAVGLAFNPSFDTTILAMRATSTAALALLHFILIVGPMARLDKRWVPLLYNRRHLGVTMFWLAFVHGVLATLYYHALGSLNPIVSIFTTDAGLTMGSFPFQAFGFFALFILFMMAATSHDFWLANLTAPVWKTLHMLVYLAYLLLIVHVAFGVLQAETHWGYAAVMALGLVTVGGLHLGAGFKQRDLDQEFKGESGDGFVKVCLLSDLVENKPSGFTVGGERVAVVLHEGNKVSAVSGVCQHQNGPLTEGKFLDGCLTCPWHGYQYKMEDGTSPPPFTEKIPVFEVKLKGEEVWVSEEPRGTGVKVEPAKGKQCCDE